MIKEFQKHRYVYIMLAPVLVYYVVIHYFPMYGLLIAFQNYSPIKGINGSSWAGLTNFQDFFHSYYFWTILRNTVLLSLYDLIFGFPAPIILALLLNESTRNFFKKLVQTISYLPHFISLVVIAGMIIDFVARDGLVNQLIVMFGGKAIPFMQRPEWFRAIYVSSNIWQHIGWESIIYLAALSAISPELYEAAKVDGAKRWSQLIHITLPGILPTIVIMLILRVGELMSVGYEKIILLYNPSIYDTADVISSFIYREGLLQMSYSYSTAVGLFNSVINFVLIVSVNRIARKSGTSLW